MESAAHDDCLRKIVTNCFHQSGFIIRVHVHRPEVWEQISNPLKNGGVKTTQFRCHSDVVAGENDTLITDKDIENLHEGPRGCVEGGVREGEGAIVLQDAQHGHGRKDESHVRDSALDKGNTSVVVLFCCLHSFVLSF